jgi:phage gp36-like protein
MYVTTAQLAERPGATELAQVATPEADAVVDPLLMDAVLRGNDTSAWSPAQVVVANDALARITDAINDAGGLIEGFLARRGYTLPLNPVPGVVVGWARAIVRYYLHKDRITDPKSDPIARDYQDALKLLQLTATGQFSLGANDTTTVAGVGMPQTITDATVRPGPWWIPE